MLNPDIHLFNDEFLAAITDYHALAQRTEVSMTDLMQDKLLLLDEGDCLRSQILALCAAQDKSEDNFRASSLETLRMMVKNGLGVTLMPSIAINPDEMDIRYIPVHSNPYRQIGLFWKQSHPKKEFFRTIGNILSYKPIP